jgi:hypothetical protein
MSFQGGDRSQIKTVHLSVNHASAQIEFLRQDQEE